MTRAALDTAQQILRNGDTELTVLIPRHEYTKAWHHLLHDRSSNSISSVLSDIAHCNVTIVPYHLGVARLPINEPSALEGMQPSVAREPPRNGSMACARRRWISLTTAFASRNYRSSPNLVCRARARDARPTVGRKSRARMRGRRRDRQHRRGLLRST